MKVGDNEGPPSIKQTCMVCGSAMEGYFSKTYEPEDVGGFLVDPLTVDYERCVGCALVVSDTHRNMTDERWGRLNEDFHHHLEANADSVGFNQPPYPEQSFALAALMDAEIIGSTDVIDYGSGYGSMAKLLRRYFSISIDLYDPYVREDNGLRYIDFPQMNAYDLVVCSAMFEHVRSRSELDAVSGLVSESGALMLHTLICETPPADPNWFYLEPVVHCTFHSNKSMAELMDQWGYVASIYSLPARSWWLLKSPVMDVEERLATLNRSFGKEWFLYSEGFLDYWK